MNEKIKLLAEQAGLNFGTNISGIELVYGTFEGSVISHIDSEELTKFAELIVAECVEQIRTGVKTNPPQAEPPELVQTLVRRIERHFGVE